LPCQRQVCVPSALSIKPSKSGEISVCGMVNGLLVLIYQ
jgi:hypothetical protein